MQGHVVTTPARDHDPMRGGAVWCEEHNRWECAKRSKIAPVCHGIAILGVDRCRMHAGEKIDIVKAKGEARSAWIAATGAPVVSDADAVMGMLQVSWLRAQLYGRLLQQQFAEAQAARGDGQGLGGGDVPALGPGAGLIGHTRSGVKDIGIFATGEALRGLTKLESDERDKVVKYAKTASDMGIAERRIQLAQSQGALIAGAISRILDALELSPSQRALVPTVVPGVLLDVAGEAATS
jgi:hypothetical protein